MLTVATMTWLSVQNICITNDHRYVPLVVNTFRSFHHSWLINGFVTRVTRRVSLVEQKLLTLPEHMGSLLVFSGVRVTRSLDLCVMFCRSLFVLFLLFSFGHCAVCPSIYGFWLSLWYPQTLLWTSKYIYLEPLAQKQIISWPIWHLDLAHFKTSSLFVHLTNRLPRKTADNCRRNNSTA